MRLTLILGESETRALQRLAAREDRAPKHQAERLLRAGLVAAGVLVINARPCDDPEQPPYVMDLADVDEG